MDVAVCTSNQQVLVSHELYSFVLHASPLSPVFRMMIFPQAKFEGIR